MNQVSTKPENISKTFYFINLIGLLNMQSLPSLTIPQMLYWSKTAKTKDCTKINTTDQTNKNQINLILIEILSTKISLSLQPGNLRLVTLTQSRQVTLRHEFVIKFQPVSLRSSWCFQNKGRVCCLQDWPEKNKFNWFVTWNLST